MLEKDELERPSSREFLEIFHEHSSKPETSNQNIILKHQNENDNLSNIKQILLRSFLLTFALFLLMLISYSQKNTEHGSSLG